jgi:hypothetical protein
MGTQQLLLIIIGLIVISSAVAGGILLFGAHAESAAQENIVSEASNLGSQAQQYYNKSAEMGGGDKSFVGWIVSEHMDSTMSAIYSVVLASDEKLILKATPQKDKNYSWAVKTTVTKSDIVSEIME